MALVLGSQNTGGPSSSCYSHFFSHQQSTQSLYIQRSSCPSAWLTSSRNRAQLESEFGILLKQFKYLALLINSEQHIVFEFWSFELQFLTGITDTAWLRLSLIGRGLLVYSGSMRALLCLNLVRISTKNWMLYWLKPVTPFLNRWPTASTWVKNSFPTNTGPTCAAAAASSTWRRFWPKSAASIRRLSTRFSTPSTDQMVRWLEIVDFGLRPVPA